MELTSPDTVPLNNTVDPHPLPPKAPTSHLYAQAVAQIKSIASNPIFPSSCAKCQASLEVAKFLIMAAPEEGPKLAVELCQFFGFSSTCEQTYSLLGIGSVVTQVVGNADVGGLDGQVGSRLILVTVDAIDDVPRPLPFYYLDAMPELLKFVSVTADFALEPNRMVHKAKAGPYSCGQEAKWKEIESFAYLGPAYRSEYDTTSFYVISLLALTDYQPLTGYATGSEANCTNAGFCCREDRFNAQSPNQTIFPAPRFGAFKWFVNFACNLSRLVVFKQIYHSDTPFSLVMAAMEAIPPLTGTQGSGFAWTIYTGDMVSHDADNQLSRSVYFP